MDGTLTGKGKDSYATFYQPHLMQPGCERNEEVYNGVICDSSAPLRRISFFGAQPSQLLRGIPMYVVKYDDHILNNYSNKSDYIRDWSHYTKVVQKPSGDPSDGWTVPFVTGYKYKVHWGDQGVDYEKMSIELSDHWLDDDKNIVIVNNFTDKRARVNITLGDEQKFQNNSLSETSVYSEASQHVVYNDSTGRPDGMKSNIIMLNGKGQKKFTRRLIKLAGDRCVGPCVDVVTDIPLSTTVKPWSEAVTWTSGKVPLAG